MNTDFSLKWNVGFPTLKICSYATYSHTANQTSFASTLAHQIRLSLPTISIRQTYVRIIFCRLSSVNTELLAITSANIAKNNYSIHYLASLSLRPQCSPTLSSIHTDLLAITLLLGDIAKLTLLRAQCERAFSAN